MQVLCVLCLLLWCGCFTGVFLRVSRFLLKEAHTLLHPWRQRCGSVSGLVPPALFSRAAGMSRNGELRNSGEAAGASRPCLAGQRVGLAPEAGCAPRAGRGRTHLLLLPPRYASLYFCCAIEGQDNELITLELIHRYVELLDKYFGSVCELDIIFNFEKAYFILDEFLMGGEVQDTSKKSVLKAIEQADLLQEVEEDESPRSVLEEMGLA
uniref:Adaptor related protein complex 1 subunit sigma 1 n=1 Tax=Varanus komodoensis TaxID=61221 RepID=A0A8D2IQG5_VARKO